MSSAATPALAPLRGGRIRWTTLLGLLLVPLTVAGLFLWGLWNPTERLGSVTAAVVNLDEPVEVDGQLVPLGRVLAAELIGGSERSERSTDAGAERQNFTWVLTDAADAKAGLDDGRFATVITIPKNFSAAATSLSDGPSGARTATIEVAESDRGRLLDTALSGIVTQTATRVLNQQLGEQFVGSVFVGMTGLRDGISEAADGATKLADGGDELAEGMSGLADGTGKLDTGMQQLASGARAAAGGGSVLSEKTAEYVNGVAAALSGLQQGAGAAVGPIAQLRALIDTGAVPPPDGTTAAEVVAGLDQLIAQLQGASVDHPESPITQLKAGGSALASGAAESAAGQQQLASGLSAIASTTPGLAEGAGKLAEGAAAAAEGTRELAKGLGTAIEQIPNYSDSEREHLASTAITAVRAEGASDELFNGSGVPLFAGIALWAGALAAFLVLSPLWSRTREAARGVFALTLRSALPAVLLGAAQGALAGVVLPVALKFDFAEGAAFFGLAVLAGMAFALVVQGLSARFGGFGRFVAFALLVVAFTVGIVSTVPSSLAAIGDASPLGAAFAGFQAVAAGVPGAGAAALLLALWGLGGVALTAWAVARERRARA